MNNPHKPAIPVHFYGLDAIRGIASIIVVLYHWQLFFYKDDIWFQDGYDKASLPLYSWFEVFYNNGMVSVDLFFLLSGFIFFWLYADRLSSRKMKFGKFVVYRVSRLYPIHFAGLMLAALLQFLILKNLGHYFIFVFNDSYDFVLHLLFMQNWGFERGPGFNAPSWSVSIEVLLYLMFYMVCFFRLQANRLFILLLIPVGAIMQHYDMLIGKGMFSFFMGGLVYYAYMDILRQNKAKQYLKVIGIITLALWTYTIVGYYFSLTHQAWEWLRLHQLSHITPEASEKIYPVLRNMLFRLTVSPCTILTLVLLETVRRPLSSRWAILGNSSYAIYLLHFPLQLLIVLLFHQFNISRQILSSPWSMLAFFSVLVTISVAAYYWYELPLQDKIRQLAFPKPPRLAVEVSDKKA
ncbi:acyltransferase [Chitinophaga sp. Cy-1792]|uniref:acyltransferase family protein n=1 Tax=Chitinophaga sp. Cy-1792 TaxID=2608339 RepID=UPI00141F5E3C|nr:acyltransferase [Chitinophaga sp. Cy-1792]NIG54444.1 acyltransferase [Chitinophaga sp. Cy-1792]